ncbi:hypothetical protein K438DRAFT_1752847 [Mycena galopus ATCC 62051]|nr:hypothetical protein K438DRAFT_1752847 [Mycena galopus ATCC 62051]
MSDMAIGRNGDFELILLVAGGGKSFEEDGGIKGKGYGIGPAEANTPSSLDEIRPGSPTGTVSLSGTNTGDHGRCGLWLRSVALRLRWGERLRELGRLSMELMLDGGALKALSAMLASKRGAADSIRDSDLDRGPVGGGEGFQLCRLRLRREERLRDLARALKAMLDGVKLRALSAMLDLLAARLDGVAKRLAGDSLRDSDPCTGPMSGGEGLGGDKNVTFSRDALE